MRLLTRGKDGELGLTEDLVDKIPSYAILSHTWSADAAEEVTFTDMRNGTGKTKAGYRKIEFCAEQAERDGLQYFWVDTCCIDKSNADELQASINSMFRWYREAARCFVYLSDVSRIDRLSQDRSWQQEFRESRWFTRGWTLQELLAPASVQFFSRDGTLLGDKESLKPEIHEITKIPVSALREAATFDQFDVVERLKWADMRQTTREEDWAYCLQGIFGVFIPLLYGEGKDNAVRRLKMEISSTPKRQEWLRKLYMCPYKDRKDRNLPRVEETCEWFTSHVLFQNWQKSSAATFLWVSADPGCGKSVLAKYLADEVLPSTTARTTCYFFFKEDFEDQRSAVTALCSILHQIFVQHPASFSAQVLKKFEDKGNRLLTSFDDLWDILISVTIGYKSMEVVCILDALDECETSERHQLIDTVSKFYSGNLAANPPLKLLVTSRPYLDIKRRFYILEHKLLTIHLSGENEEELKKISCEIDLVIRSRVVDISRRLGLLEEEQYRLLQELLRTPNRTYLWVHLILDIISKSIIDGEEDILSIVQSTDTVDAAYDKILSKSPDAGYAKKLLHIVVAASRPLTLYEMALALTIKPHHRSFDDLKLGPEDRIRENVRQHCGLFVVVVDSRIYLLHQTAREFLVSLGSTAAPPISATLKWKFSLRPQESSGVLAQICILRLSLSDFSLQELRAAPYKEYYIAKHIFLEYAAHFWTDHFGNSDWRKSEWITRKALSYFNPELPASLAWFEIFQAVTTRVTPEIFMPLLVASCFGLNIVVENLLEGGADANVNDDSYGKTPLYWASRHGHDAIVQQLLEAGADVNAKDKDDWMPLHWASKNGHDAVVQQLLEGGADVNAKDKHGWASLCWATTNDHDAVVQQLLEAGADVNAEDKYGGTPLYWASMHGHDAIVQQLLEGGADVNTKDKDGWTPLYCASRHGHDAIVQMLFEAGAQYDDEL